ncbi:MAG: enoyl-CoA hydratase-related protein [Ottowia sp.]|uniref:enoyl-CoA hydratase-related protein n=1 Tax=Ottowia sp. TaxID=1898956 RepID=UPI003C756796
MQPSLSSSGAAPVLVHHADRVCTITINRPDARNALNAQVAAGIASAISDATQRAECRAIVLTGAGDRAFCAGADLVNASGSVFNVDFADPRHFMADLLQRMEDCPLPLIARVNGHAMAGGFGLVCACDLAVAADSATFGTPEAKVGISPMMILPHMLRVLPRRVLREMCLTGEPLSAAEALAHDIVNYVVPAAELDTKLAWLIARVVDKSPTGLRLGKQALRTMDGLNIGESLDYAQIMVTVLSSTPDAREGMVAFRERRKPRWRGEAHQ